MLSLGGFAFEILGSGLPGLCKGARIGSALEICHPGCLGAGV